jgi:hypothetical protein
VLSLYFIYRVLNGLDKNLRVIAEKMELRPEPETMRHQLLGIQEILNFRSWLRSLFNPSRKPSAQNGFVNVQDVWQAYVFGSGSGGVRAYLFTCGMYLFGKYVLVPMLGKPMIPVRGHDLAFDWYMWTIWGNVLLMQLTFLVFDATLYCLLFVYKLSPGPIAMAPDDDGSLQAAFAAANKAYPGLDRPRVCG